VLFRTLLGCGLESSRLVPHNPGSEGSFRMTAEIRATIETQALAREFLPGELDYLAQAASPVQWAAGETVFREGNCNDDLYLILAGRVAIEISVPQRGRVRIATIGPDELFGWSSLFYQKPKTALAAVLEPTQALAFNAAVLRELSEQDAGFGFHLTRAVLRIVSDRLKATRAQLIDMFAR
jgi:CRP/FNR family cyclic AMP-dependent transcriptional regulator